MKGGECEGSPLTGTFRSSSFWMAAVHADVRIASYQAYRYPNQSGLRDVAPEVANWYSMITLTLTSID